MPAASKSGVWVAVITTVGVIVAAYLQFRAPAKSDISVTVQGVVEGVDTGMGIEGALVEVATNSAPIRATTDSRGFYLVKLPGFDGSITAHFAVSAVNYEPQTATYTIMPKDNWEGTFKLTARTRTTPVAGAGSTVVPSQPKIVTRKLGTCAFAKFEYGPNDLMKAFTIYSNDKDRCYISFTPGLKLADGSPLNSIAVSKAFEANRANMSKAGYVRSEISGEYQVRVFVTGSDILFDPKQRLLCALATIEFQTRE